MRGNTKVLVPSTWYGGWERGTRIRRRELYLIGIRSVHMSVMVADQ